MRYFVFGACILSFLSFTNVPGSGAIVHSHFNDTGHIIHALDGLTDEWPWERFHLSDDSTVEYALDNDDKNLYVAMTIPDFGEQTKIMRNGMKLFIDLKGKKKEGKGIEFPIQGEASSSVTNSPGYASAGPNGDDSKKLDRKTARSIMSLGIVALKLFGFGGDTKEDQGLTMPGSVNVAFKWDESDAMHIEYNIPLNLLGESSSLNEKDISIGWKINGFDRPPGEHGSQYAGNSEGGGGGYSRGMHGGGHGGGGQYGGGGSRGFGTRPPATYKKIDPEQMRKEQNFWTKYVITPPPQKAF